MCKFCEAIEDAKKRAAIMKKEFPDMGIWYRYSAALATRTFVQDSNIPIVTSHESQRGGHWYDLNFCPECGRKLAKNSAIDSPSKSQ